LYDQVSVIVFLHYARSFRIEHLVTLAQSTNKSYPERKDLRFG